MKKIIWLFLLFFLIIFSNNLLAADIWIVMDKISLNRLVRVETENIDLLQKKGACSLVNVRTADGIESKNTYLSIGAGERALGNYLVHSGTNYKNGVINRNISHLIQYNEDNLYDPYIGLLGEVAQEKGLKIAVIGNTDNLTEKKRTIVSMLMNSQGYVPVGDVSQNILKSSKNIGIRTDWEQVKKYILEYKNNSDIIVVETGDFTRIADSAEFLNETEIDFLKDNTLKTIDNFIGDIIKQVDLEKSRIGIIVPTPPRKAIKRGEKLSWFLVAGNNIDRGLLTSLSTRREGIINIKDILPTMLENVNNGKISGNQVTSIPKEINWRNLIKLNQKITKISNLRPAFIKGFIFMQLLVIILGIFNIIYKKNFKSEIFNIFFENFLLAILMIPFNYLIISFFYFRVWIIYLIFLIILTVAELYLLKLIKMKKIEIIFLLSFITSSIIIIDLIFNIDIMADSLLGYSSIIGARYYGLGNEYMGFLIGGFLVFCTGLIEIGEKNSWKIFKNYKVIFFSILALTVVFITGMGSLGANFGGTITAMVASLVTLVYIKDRPFSIINIFSIIVIIILFLLTLFTLDYLEYFGPASHIGKIIEKLFSGNQNIIINIILRKVRINLRLLKWTIWTKVLLGFILYLFIIFLYPKRKLKKFLAYYPEFAASIYGGLAGSFITMLVNDSGVVAAATILFFPVLCFLYLYQEFKKNNLKDF
ncbi:MAG: hypothetical protein ACOC4G_07500 [Bacillota bacterium]